MLRYFPYYGVPTLDAVIITHDHADACMGLDDLRGVQKNDTTQAWRGVSDNERATSDLLQPKDERENERNISLSVSEETEGEKGERSGEVAEEPEKCVSMRLETPPGV